MNIAELVLGIRADSSQAVKEVDKAKKSVVALGDSAKISGESIRKYLDTALTSLAKSAIPIATVTGAMVALTRAQDELVSVGKQAEATGIPVEDLQAWGRAAESLGYSSEDAKNALVSLQTGMQEAALTGQGKMAGMLNYLGISMKDANGQIRSSSDLMKDLSARFSGMSQQKAFYLGKMMGLTPDTIALLRQGKNLTKELGEAYKHVQSAEDIEKAKQLDLAIGALTTAWGDLAKNLLVSVAPAITAVLKAIQPLAQFMADNPFLTTFATSALMLRSKLTMLVPVFSQVATAGLNALKVLSVAFKANPIGLAVTALIAVFTDFFAFLNGAPSLTGNFLDWIGVSKKSIEEFKQSVLDTWEGVKNFFGFGDEKKEGEKTEGGWLQSVTGGASASSVPTTAYSSNSNVSNRNVSMQAHNEITVNMGNNANPQQVRSAVENGVTSAMGKYQGVTDSFDSGVIDK